MSGVEPAESGLASGVVDTAQMMGGAVGLAVLVSLAANRTDSLEATGNGAVSALNGGYHLAFALAAVFALAAAGAAFALIRAALPAMAHGELSEPALDAPG